MESIRVGDVLSRSFRAFRENLGGFGIVGAALFAPMLLPLALGLSMLPEGGAPAEPPAWFFLAIILSSLLTVPFFGGIVHGTLAWLRNEETTIGEMLGRGFRRSLIVVGTGMVLGILVTAGYLFLIIPGLIIFFAFAVALPAAVGENIGPVEALKRSAALTKGNRFTLFVIYLLSSVLSQAAVIFASFALMFAIQFLGGAAARPMLLVSVMAAAGAAATFQIVVLSVSYHQLRELRDGPRPERIAEVFS